MMGKLTNIDDGAKIQPPMKDKITAVLVQLTRSGSEFRLDLYASQDDKDLINVIYTF